MLFESYLRTDNFLKEVENYDVTIMNLANGDMVGHTGNYEAAKSAVEHMDKCIKKIYDKVMELNGILIIIADHGNCDMMWDENKQPSNEDGISKIIDNTHNGEIILLHATSKTNMEILPWCLTPVI